MKLQPYIEKLNSSQEYKDFHKKYTDAFVVAGFFVIDLEMGKNVHQVDYYVPSKKKIAAFSLDEKITMQLLDLLNEKVPEKLDIKTKIDLDQLQGILMDEMKNRSITDDIKKIIAVLQSVDGKKIWNLNCILSGMGVLNAHVEDESRSVLKMEKKSLIDIMKKVPIEEVNLQPGKSAKAANAEVKEKIKKLDALEKEIEKEKAELKKEEQEIAPKTDSNKQKIEEAPIPENNKNPPQAAAEKKQKPKASKKKAN